MSMQEPTTSALRWGTQAVEVGQIPNVSLMALIQRGLTHIHGNEVASTVTARKDKFATEHHRDMSEAEVGTLTQELRAEKLKQILAGELGTRSVVARLPQIDKVMRDIAEATIRVQAQDKGQPMPKGDVLKILVERVVAQHDTMLRGKAQAKIDADKAMAREFGNLLGGEQGVKDESSNTPA